MKPFEPIPVYPLRMRGRFGLTRHLYRNGFGGAFCFSLVYVLIIALLAALCLAPLGFAILRSDTVQSLMDALTQNLPQEIPMIPGVEGYDWQFSFGEFSGAAFNTAGILLRSLGTVILLLVLWGGVTFFLHPLYQSTMYAEMNARVHGQACSFAEMWQRSMPCLRANYATYIALLVGKIGAGIVSSFGAQLLSLFSGLLALFAVAMPVFGFGVLLPLMTGLGACMGLAVSSFILLTFPVGVAEPNKDFSALGRSIKLGFHNFWRIFSSLLLRELYIWLLMLPGACLLVAGIFIADNRVAIPLLVLGVLWMLFVRVYFMGFRIAFDTALYQDMTARENIPPLHAQPVNAQPV
ncbi:MAG: hypothetical protein Q4E65_06075, partial [Clostridia bacterium]|nr:hypothetical protein [Clostridia bacterium]